ncbi:MAG: peroxidase family protein [Geminicoccaceae bacterium]
MSSVPFSERLLARIFGPINRHVEWYRMPGAWLQVLNLLALRGRLRERNLYDTYPPRLEHKEPIPEPFRDIRSADGGYNDPRYPELGRAHTRFGRNVPLAEARPASDEALLSPNPREISNRLLARRSFIPASHLNVLAAAWLQFMVHDWFGHGKNIKHNAIEVDIPEGDDWHERPMTVARTQMDPSLPDGGPKSEIAHINVFTHWWDASQIYGNNVAEQTAIRTFEDGRLKIAENGHLELDAENIELTGINDNWWIGLSVLHTLFHREHNVIAGQLRKAYPGRDDEWLFQKARLINAALLAKIHTVEWTPAILDTKALRIAMNGNWWGLLGENLQRRFGRLSRSEALSGILGSEPSHHTAPFSMTEEFVSVYRMHPLIPDDFSIRRIEDNHSIATLSLKEIAGRETHKLYERASLEDALYSLGTDVSGAICLGNYPNELRRFTRQEDGEVVDLGSLDIIRDRERGVPAYNRFRELMGMKRVESIEALTSDPHWRAELNDIYEGDIDKLDPMVGMFAEAPPPGFAFSDTAFRIFILMASRRLKSDRFFTTDYRPEVYTPEGMAWINDVDFSSLLVRHLPRLAGTLEGLRHPFAPWNRS